MVFFSGTDLSELDDNAPNHNIYLSLIVNNYMDFTAKVAFIAEASTNLDVDLIARDENGEKYTYEVIPFVAEARKLITYDCDIESPKKDVTISSDFKSKVAFIIEKAAKIIRPNVGIRTSPNYTSRWDAYEEDWEFKVKKDVNSNKVNVVNLPKSKNKQPKKKVDDLKDEENSFIDSFAMTLLNSGNKIAENDEMEDILDNLQAFKVDTNNISLFILNNYSRIYNEYFNFLEDVDDTIVFIDILEMTIESIDIEATYQKSKYNREILEAASIALNKLLINFTRTE